MGTDVDVDPGDIEDFGKLAMKLADDWVSKGSAPNRLVTGSSDSYDYPTLGKFQEAEDFLRAYGGDKGTLQDAVTAFNALHALLESVGDASKKIADEYRTVEALNNAGVEQINKILGEEFKGSDPSAPGDTGQPPTDQP